MARYLRNTAILAKIEVTPGTDPTPTGAANAMLVSNVSINPLNAQNVDRDNIRPYFGNNEELVGTKFVEMSFDIEMAGSGAAGTAPKYGPLLQACAMAETLNAGVSAEYNPITNNQKSVTIYWYDDGLLHAMTYGKGDFTIKAGISGRPVFSFKFTGLYVVPTAAANPSLTLTGFQKPLVITDTNTGDVTFGATYATSAISGGTSFPSRGIGELAAGNTVAYTPRLGGDVVDVTDRKATLKVELDLTAAEAVSKYADVVANVTSAVSLQHGVTGGNIVLLHMPVVQLINPGKGDTNGRRFETFDGRVIPSAGNDELIICVK